jgi:hypothetical protein
VHRSRTLSRSTTAIPNQKDPNALNVKNSHLKSLKQNRLLSIELQLSESNGYPNKIGFKQKATNYIILCCFSKKNTGEVKIWIKLKC